MLIRAIKKNTTLTHSSSWQWISTSLMKLNFVSISNTVPVSKLMIAQNTALKKCITDVWLFVFIPSFVLKQRSSYIATIMKEQINEKTLQYLGDPFPDPWNFPGYFFRENHTKSRPEWRISYVFDSPQGFLSLPFYVTSIRWLKRKLHRIRNEYKKMLSNEHFSHCRFYSAYL